ncbi:MAG: ribose-5-phosphate isomerase RpiA [Caldilineaceae bacterium]|nr:ribose-5-phosphate isomerase RpiA [Caldilineaceae bacterium]
MTTFSIDLLKRQAAEAAVDLIQPGMVVGLGAGSTALKAIECMGERLADGRLHRIVGVPCSGQVAADAQRLGVPLTTLDEHPVIDLTIDGADEVDPQLRVIKGGGGALLREKIVAQASRQEVIIVDEGKLSDRLGTKWVLPVEVIPFGWRTHLDFFTQLGATVNVRTGDRNVWFRTDSGNLILDCNFGPMADPDSLAAVLDARAGVVAHGLFIGLVSQVVVAGVNGVYWMTHAGVR